MLSLRDCMEYVRLTADEIDAVAEHEHIPEIIAAEMAHYLVELPEGTVMLKRMIVDDIERAAACGHCDRAARLVEVLKQFIAAHPDHAATPNRPELVQKS